MAINSIRYQNALAEARRTVLALSSFTSTPSARGPAKPAPRVEGEPAGKRLDRLAGGLGATLNKKQALKMEPSKKSLVRDVEGKNCKKRPEDNTSKGGGSRAWVPWCDRRK